MSATDAERRFLAARTKWWNSTGGGSTSRTISGQQGQQGSNSKGFGAIKSGDGGKKFREQWPEVDAENWKWMEEQKIDAQTGKSLLPQQPSCSPETAALRRRVGGTTAIGAVVDGGREVGAAGQGFLRRNALYLVLGVLFAYVVAARMLGEQ